MRCSASPFVPPITVPHSPIDLIVDNFDGEFCIAGSEGCRLTCRLRRSSSHFATCLPARTGSNGMQCCSRLKLLLLSLAALALWHFFASSTSRAQTTTQSLRTRDTPAIRRALRMSPFGTTHGQGDRFAPERYNERQDPNAFQPPSPRSSEDMQARGRGETPNGRVHAFRDHNEPQHEGGTMLNMEQKQPSAAMNADEEGYKEGYDSDSDGDYKDDYDSDDSDDSDSGSDPCEKETDDKKKHKHKKHHEGAYKKHKKHKKDDNKDCKYEWKADNILVTRIGSKNAGNVIVNLHIGSITFAAPEATNASNAMGTEVPATNNQWFGNGDPGGFLGLGVGGGGPTLGTTTAGSTTAPSQAPNETPTTAPAETPSPAPATEAPTPEPAATTTLAPSTDTNSTASNANDPVAVSNGRNATTAADPPSVGTPGHGPNGAATTALMNSTTPATPDPPSQPTTTARPDRMSQRTTNNASHSSLSSRNEDPRRGDAGNNTTTSGLTTTRSSNATAVSVLTSGKQHANASAGTITSSGVAATPTPTSGKNHTDANVTRVPRELSASAPIPFGFKTTATAEQGPIGSELSSVRSKQSGKREKAMADALASERHASADSESTVAAPPALIAPERDRDDPVGQTIASGQSVDAFGRAQLFIAAERGDIDAVRALLGCGATVDLVSNLGLTSLRIAAEKGHFDAVRVLADNGASVDLASSDGWTPLDSAAWHGHTDIVTLLLQHAASVDLVSSDGWTPLNSAAWNRHVGAVTALLERGASVGLASSDGLAPLNSAARHGYLDVVTTLLQYGPNLDLASTMGWTPLNSAGSNGYAGVVAALIEHGVGTHVASNSGWTPLNRAAKRGYLDVVAVLLKHTPDINMPTNGGSTPLHSAARSGHVDIVRTLLEHAPDIDFPAKGGWTALSSSSKNGHIEVVSALLNGGASIDHKSHDGWTPLNSAAKNGHGHAVTKLLLHGASIDSASSDGSTPLNSAAKSGHLDVVLKLLQRGVSTHIASSDGLTPLTSVAKNGHADVVAVLLQHTLRDSAAGNRASNSDVNPLWIAAQNGQLNVVELPFQDGADVEVTDAEGKTALHVASQEGHEVVVDFFLSNGIMPDTPDRNGNTPLISASRSGHLRVVRRLLNSSASLYAVNEAGESPLIAAVASGNFEIAGLFVEAGAPPHIRTIKGDTILTYAAQWGSIEIVNQLLESEDLNPHATQGSGATLLAGTLQTLRDNRRDVNEFEELWRSVADRLTYVHDQPVTAGKESYHPLLHQYVMTLLHFTRVKALCERSIYLRLVASRNIVNRLQDFHTEITFLQRKFKSARQMESIDWEAKWKSDETYLMTAFQEAINADVSWLPSHENEASQSTSIALLQHELNVHDDKYSPEMLQILKRALARVPRESLSAGNDSIPDRLIPPHEFDTVLMEADNGADAKRALSMQWLNATVNASRVRTSQDKFVDAVNQWVCLSHPNVVKMFGASHLELPYVAVFENATHTNLREYLRLESNQRFVWQRLLEVALGLKYLHERGIILAYVSCEHIWVGADGAAKICGFGIGLQEEDWGKGVQGTRWRSPECLHGAVPLVMLNIYSLAMCIYEAVAGEVPWSHGEDSRVSAIARGSARPEIPAECGEVVTDLMWRMWCANPVKRLNLAAVIEHLKQFGESQIQHEDVPSEEDVPGSRSVDFDTFMFPQFASTLPVFLDTLESKCAKSVDSRDSVLHIFGRLRSVYGLFRQHQMAQNDFVVVNYCQVLLRLDRFLRTALSADSVLQRAKSRVVWLQKDLLHRDIDELLNLMSVSSDDPVHNWSEQSSARDADIGHLNDVIHRLQKPKAATANEAIRILRLDSETMNERFERVQHGDIGMNESKATTSRPLWFIPTYELKYDRDDPIGTGAFGDMYKATWLGTSVVVKFMGYEADGDEYSRDMFFHELQVWFPLNHPHVIKLFGACHVGKRYFTCEYAGNGRLDVFLKIGDNFKKWRKLHQVALGLQYLHSLNIMHNDLKCDNILIGTNGNAKITDFGLSCIPNSAEVKIESKKIGAVQWRSPEYLRGERPTVASDLYAFGMCILEAVSGDFPWGRQLDTSVRFHVLKGNLPLVAMGCLAAEEHALVEMICARNPSERIQISLVVEKLDEFAKLESASVNAAPGLLLDGGPP